MGFNPRAREGRDDKKTLHIAVKSIQFQSTRPRGARLLYDSTADSLLCFNPRAREGRDKKYT